MLVAVRRALIRTLLPLSWRLRRARPVETLTQFAETEADSGWQFLRAFERCDDPRHRAHLFRNLLEEREHTSLFVGLVEARGGRVVLSSDGGRTSLLDQENGLAEFLAYVQAGEHDIAQEFQEYAQAVGAADVRAVFDHIQEEEDGHHSTLWQALLAVAGSQERAHQLVRRARRRRGWRTFLRAGKRMGDAFLGLWLTVIYVALGPLSVFAGRRRLNAPR